MIETRIVVEMYLDFEFVVDNLESPTRVAEEGELPFRKGECDGRWLLSHDNCDVELGVVQERGDLVQQYLEGIFLDGLDFEFRQLD
jgi:hypothetical protein